jgi:hypothetical protein
MRQMHVISLLRAMTWRELAGLAIAVSYMQAWVPGSRQYSREGRHVMTPTVSMPC